MRNFTVGLSAAVAFGWIVFIALATEPKPPATFPEPINSETDTTTRAMAPDEAARGFRVPAGFHVSVFAAEPDVQNPIAFAWDSRGRLWVAENYTYADRTKKFDLSLRDRVLILEDTDGDGRFDKRVVFTDDLQMLAGLEIGDGGVWLMTPPQLIFIPDRDGDDKPDGAPIVMLDGFTPATDNHHTFANGLKWGPDGWLYGRCGASSPGRLGLPGTADDKRVPLFGGIWRFRPDRRRIAMSSADRAVSSRSEGVVEVLCHGTTNPWGHDWNEHGEAFFVNTVNGHLWHVIPGAHFRRPHSEDPNPYVYDTIDTHADHYHWDTGKDWTDSRNVKGEHDRLGGGHAHSGATIYLGDNWPDDYRGKLLTLNLHGRRINVERLQPSGAGYVGQHEPDMLFAADPWFRGIDLGYGPDGAVYLLDWSDTGECHEQTGVHRTSGRIFKVWHGERSQKQRQTELADLSKLRSKDPSDLVDLHRHRNEWFVRQARRQLATELAFGHGTVVDSACIALRKQFEDEPDTVQKLRALHTLFELGACDESFLQKLVRYADPHIRAWGWRLLTDAWPLDTIMGRPHPLARETIPEATMQELVRSAKEDMSGLVRLVLSSTLQRLPLNRRLALATALATHATDATDHNLPLMIWYGIMPIAKSEPESIARFSGSCQFPVTRRLISRRLAELIDEQPRSVEIVLADAMKTPVALLDCLQGLTQGVAGRHKLKPPKNWSDVQQAVQQAVAKSDDKKLAELVRDLSVLFGDGRALDEVQRVALNGKADLASRRLALQTLIDNRAPDRRKICEQLLSVRYLNTTAIRGLTEFDDASIGEKLAKSYRSFFPSDRPSVIEALVSRPAFAESLLEQIAAGKIPVSELSVAQVRQIRSFGNSKLNQRLTEVWGELRDSPADKQQLIEKFKHQLTTQELAAADKSQGRAVYMKVCASCHRLYSHGGQIGPDLTGSGRQNLDYVLLNLIDPSATIGIDYRMSTVVLKDGRVLNGIAVSKTEKVLTLQTTKDRMPVEIADVEEILTSTQSLMPDGLLQPLSSEQIRDLVAYLMHPTQVPLNASNDILDRKLP